MEHLAILKKDLRFLGKIISGEKKIESRWYKYKQRPWDTVHTGDTIYFKESGEPVTVKARARKIVQYDNLDDCKVLEILEKNYKDIGITKDTFNSFYNRLKDRKYCILIYLENVKRVEKPFNINKSGYGNMVAWIPVESILKLKC